MHRLIQPGIGRAGQQQGKGGAGQGERGRGREAPPRPGAAGKLEASLESPRHLARPSSVERCQGVFLESLLMVTSQARGSTEPVSLARPERPRAAAFGKQLLVCGAGQPQRQAGI